MTEYEVITGADRAILEQYCVLMAQLRSSHEEFTASLHSQLRGLANDLYLTPDSRAKGKLNNPYHTNPTKLLNKFGL